MSTFFENQLNAKRRTKQLLFLYVLAILVIVLGIYLLFAFTLASGVITGGMSPLPFESKLGVLWNSALFLKVFLGVSIIIALASVFKSLQLGGSGARVASMLNGRLINPNTTLATEKQILNIVEEIAIASGMKVPPIYVMEEEASINAFAAGTRLDNAVIGVSRGALETLSRDELQGVVAHEFSHILNGDMRLNLRLIGILFGILFIALTGRLIVEGTARSSNSYRRRSNGKSDGGSVIIIGIGLLVIGYTGVFFAKLIKMAVSRQREYLADASAVQYTRNPLGIAGALKKIGALADGSKIKNAHAEEISHMFFANGLKSSFTNLFATHPPLTERIQRLDRSFDGDFQSVDVNTTIPRQARDEATSRQARGPEASASGGPLDPLLKNPALESILNNPAGNILGTIGTMGFANLEAARNLINNLPPQIHQAVHEPYLAPFVIYTLLLDAKPDIRGKQLQILEQNLPSSSFQEFSKLLITSKEVNQNDFLSILDLALPTLNMLSESQFKQMRDLVTHLAHADANLDLHEYTLQIILLKHYDLKFNPEKFKGQKNKPLGNLVQFASDLFLCLAVLGNKDNLAVAEEAYRAGIKHCAIPAEFQHNFQELPKVGFHLLDQAIKELSNSEYNVREVLLRACISCISIDKKISTHEFTLIRAIADSFNCPVPYLGS